MARLENWYMLKSGSIYSSPELLKWVVYGNVYGSDRFVDGSNIKTSMVEYIKLDKGFVQTMNTKYELGNPDSKWVSWCEEKGHSLKLFESMFLEKQNVCLC